MDNGRAFSVVSLILLSDIQLDKVGKRQNSEDLQLRTFMTCLYWCRTQPIIVLFSYGGLKTVNGLCQSVQAVQCGVQTPEPALLRQLLVRRGRNDIIIVLCW